MFHIYVWRQDSFDGDIALSVEGLPKGVTCSPQTLAAGLRHTVLVIHAAADAPALTALKRETVEERDRTGPSNARRLPFGPGQR